MEVKDPGMNKMVLGSTLTDPPSPAGQIDNERLTNQRENRRMLELEMKYTGWDRAWAWPR